MKGDSRHLPEFCARASIRNIARKAKEFGFQLVALAKS